MKLTIPGGTALEDNTSYTNRFEIASETSNKLYIVAQNKVTGEWSCSCPGWIIKRPGKPRTCKHLQSLLPLLQEAQNPAPKRIEEKKTEKYEAKKTGRKLQA